MCNGQEGVRAAVYLLVMVMVQGRQHRINRDPGKPKPGIMEYGRVQIEYEFIIKKCTKIKYKKEKL